MQWEMYILSYLQASTKYNIYKLPKNNISFKPSIHTGTKTFL